MTCLGYDLGKGSGKLSGIIFSVFASQDRPIACVDGPLYWLVVMIMITSLTMQRTEHVFIGCDHLHALLHRHPCFGASQVSQPTQIKFCHLSVLINFCKGRLVYQ